jgi:hypothetical protein
LIRQAEHTRRRVEVVREPLSSARVTLSIVPPGQCPEVTG